MASPAAQQPSSPCAARFSPFGVFVSFRKQWDCLKKKNGMATTGLDFDYYQLYLQRHLQDVGSELVKDVEFIHSRAELASDEYETARRSGVSFHASQERAMKVLMENLV